MHMYPHERDINALRMRSRMRIECIGRISVGWNESSSASDKDGALFDRGGRAEMRLRDTWRGYVFRRNYYSGID